MDLQRPVFNEHSNKSPKNQDVATVQGFDTKITAPKVATNFKKHIKYIILSLLIVIIITTCLIFAFAPNSVKEISEIKIVPVVNNIDFDFPENSFDPTVDDKGNKTLLIMPGNAFSAKVSVTSKIDEDFPTLAGDVFVRFRMEAYVLGENNVENYYGDLLQTSITNDLNGDWFNDNKYFYYNDILKPEQTISAQLNMIVDQENTPNNLQSKTLYIKCTFEVLQSSAYQSISEVWVSAPYAWRSLISKKMTGKV